MQLVGFVVNIRTLPAFIAVQINNKCRQIFKVIYEDKYGRYDAQFVNNKAQIVDLQDPLDLESSNVIYNKGCIEQGESWLQQYMIPVAGAIVGVAVVLVSLHEITSQYTMLGP